MTPTWIRELRGDRSKVQFARLMSVHRRTVTNWERGLTRPRGESLRLLHDLAQGRTPNRALYAATDEELLAEVSRRMQPRPLDRP